MKKKNYKQKNKYGSENHIANKHKSMRNKAKARGIEWNLSKTELGKIITDLPERCPCCKAQYNWSGNSMQSPSIDRFDNSIGYQSDNIIVICAKCNSIKGGIEGSNNWNSRNEQNRMVAKWYANMWATRSIMNMFNFKKFPPIESAENEHAL